MSDLISRSAVLDIIHKAIDKTTDFMQHDTQLDIMHEVEELPTAYNVDEVVKELLDRKIYFENCYEMKNDWCDCARFMVYADVVEIVRKGGVK